MRRPGPSESAYSILAISRRLLSLPFSLCPYLPSRTLPLPPSDPALPVLRLARCKLSRGNASQNGDVASLLRELRYRLANRARLVQELELLAQRQCLVSLPHNDVFAPRAPRPVQLAQACTRRCAPATFVEAARTPLSMQGGHARAA